MSRIDCLQERRSIHRGQNVYHQKSYDLNRLRYELENNLRAPRHKPYFHRVNEVYSYYLPPKFTKINSNVENFSHRYGDRMKSDHSFGTKTRSMTRMRGRERVEEFTGRELPSHTNYGGGGQRVRGFPNSAGPPIPSSQYQSIRPNYGDPYQRVSPESIRRGLPSDSTSAGLPLPLPRIPFTPPREPALYSADTTGLIPEPQSLIRNSTFPGIPGWQRVDFPGYSSVPATGFRCASQPYYGYYADVNAGCQVWMLSSPESER